MFLFSFFFFKQKTAYEMRISDWSSDVCSSDLAGVFPTHRSHLRGATAYSGALPAWRKKKGPQRGPFHVPAKTPLSACRRRHKGDASGRCRAGAGGRSFARGPRSFRSEEHTSELQSLMRISYAVFCLKKKNNI